MTSDRPSMTGIWHKPMSSWTLIRYLIGQIDTDNPLFLRETQRPPIWHGLFSRLIQATGALLVLTGLSCYAAFMTIYLLHSLLGVVVPVILLWVLIVGLTLGPVIVSERQGGTWDTLRTTPLLVPRIILGKAGGALWWLNEFTRFIIGLMVLFACGVGLLALVILANAQVIPITSGWVLCGLVLGVPVFSAFIFLFDRVQLFALMTSGALTVSASSRSLRGALVASSAAAIVIWFADAAIAAVVIALSPSVPALTSPGDLALLLTVGPLAGYLTALSPTRAGLYMAITLAARELLVRGLWRVTVRSAKQE